MNKILIAVGGVVGALAIAVGIALTTGGSLPTQDRGGVASTELPTSVPNVRDDPMAPVGKAEADRRATLNQHMAQEAEEKGKSYVSPTVIEEKFPVGSDKDPYQQPSATQPPQATQASLATSAPATPQPPQVIYVPASPNQQQLVQKLADRVQSQIDYAAQLPKPNFVVMAFAKPQPPASAAQATPAGTSPAAASPPASMPPATTTLASYSGNQPRGVAAAMPGDRFYGLLEQGFNSDDPRGMPIFATIYDEREDGTRGPLHGARLMGSVSFSRESASARFNRLILGNRVIPVEAMAVDEETMRSGIATDVDHHTLERYSALFAAGLLQGIGEVGQQLVDRADNVTVSPLTGTVIYGNDDVNWTEAAMGTVRPVGDAFSRELGRGFGRPPTVSNDGSKGVGIVFLAPVYL